MEKGYPGEKSMDQLQNILLEFPCSLHASEFLRYYSIKADWEKSHSND